MWFCRALSKANICFALNVYGSYFCSYLSYNAPANPSICFIVFKALTSFFIILTILASQFKEYCPGINYSAQNYCQKCPKNMQYAVVPSSKQREYMFACGFPSVLLSSEQSKYMFVCGFISVFISELLAGFFIILTILVS